MVIRWIFTASNLIMSIKEKKAAFLTLGCRVNQYETQCVREELLRSGFREVPFSEEADLYFINTCAVTGESVRKGKQMIRRALRNKERNPSALVCVCGCFPQGEGENELLSRADIVTGNTGKSRLSALILSESEKEISKRERIDLREDIAKPRPYENMSLCRSHNARAFVKIQDGCNSFCSYCFVPFVRGRVRSRSLAEVVKEVKTLSQNGYREVVLTGIETGSWGEDLKGEESLLDLVREVSGISGIERIRFGSLKPSVFTEEFCSSLSKIPKVLPHFHLSLQSGSSAVLKAMRRKYGREEEERAVDTIYRYFPDAGLSADLICGFPGEREEDFNDSLTLVQRAGLLHTHIFPFSPRKGTLAEKMEPKVSEEIKKERCAKLLSTAKEESLRFVKEREGKVYHVLCERIRDGFMLGYTENFIYTKTPVDENVCVGEIYPVKLGKDNSFSVETLTVSGEMA